MCFHLASTLPNQSCLTCQKQNHRTDVVIQSISLPKFVVYESVHISIKRVFVWDGPIERHGGVVGDDERMVKQRTHNGPHCSKLIIRADMELGWESRPRSPRHSCWDFSLYSLHSAFISISLSRIFSPSLSFPFSGCFSFLCLKWRVKA